MIQNHMQPNFRAITPLLHPRKEGLKRKFSQFAALQPSTPLQPFHQLSAISFPDNAQKLWTHFPPLPSFPHPYHAFSLAKQLELQRQRYIEEQQDLVGSDTDSVSVEQNPPKKQKSKRKCATSSSVFKGVSWHKRDKCYMARVWVDGVSKHIGSYQEEMRAAVAVDKRLQELGRDVSYMNFSSNLERDIALSILERTGKVDESLSPEERRKLFLDMNGYPNSIVAILETILNRCKEREEKKFSPKSKKKLLKLSPQDGESAQPRLNTLIDVATIEAKALEKL